MNSNDRITPEGTKDYLFKECKLKRKAEKTLRNLFETQGYDEVMTPALEYYDVFSKGIGRISQDEMYTLTDNSGRLVTMRPDSTKPIARLYASRLKQAKLPLKLYYNQTVFRRNIRLSKFSDEITQIGVELLGAEGLAADIEILLLAAQSMKELFGDNFRIEIGHMGIISSLLEQPSTGDKDALRSALAAKNYPEIEAIAGAEKDGIFSNLFSLFGGTEVLARAKKLFDYDGAANALEELTQAANALEEKGFKNNIIIDLAVINEYDYYTGLVFKGYVAGQGKEVLSGGRYDTLYTDYDLDLSAIGFAVNIDEVVKVLGNEAATKQVKDTFTIALTKGRLEEQALRLLENSGLDCSSIRNKGRKLIINLDDKYEILFAKARDVVTYVEYGVADAGVVGKDVLLEMGRPVHEVLDLGFGKCRFSLAAQKGQDFYSGYKLKTVATKYPEFTKSFFNSRNMDVEIIKIEGSVELAPLLSLADGIVDLVETGSTLKENGLEIIEDICNISARLIVNSAALRLKKRTIEELIGRLSND